MNLIFNKLYFYGHLFLIFTLYTTQGQDPLKIHLKNDWDFLRVDLRGIWEAMQPVVQVDAESVPLWARVSVLCCFNAQYAVDLKIRIYQGPNWYKNQIGQEYPLSQGRTLFHVEGEGQENEVYVYSTRVDTHPGGYDAWTLDITDAVEASKNTEVFQKQFGGQIPIFLRCYNSRDLDMVPSDVSDLNFYGGLYRYLNLMYMPAFSVERIFAPAETYKAGKLSGEARLHNPTGLDEAITTIRLLHPQGEVVGKFATYNKSFNVGKSEVSITFEAISGAFTDVSSGNPSHV